MNSHSTELCSCSRRDEIVLRALSSQMSNKAKLWISCGPHFFFFCTYEFVNGIIDASSLTSPSSPSHSDGDWFSGLFLNVASFFKLNFIPTRLGPLLGTKAPSMFMSPFSLQATESGLGRQKAEELGRPCPRAPHPNADGWKQSRQGWALPS